MCVGLDAEVMLRGRPLIGRAIGVHEIADVGATIGRPPLASTNEFLYNRVVHFGVRPFLWR